MPTTVVEAVKALRERLDEKNPGTWEDRELRRWLNEGIRDIARRTQALTDVDTIAVVSGTGEYTVTADVLRINFVYFNPTGQTQQYPLEARPWEAMNNVWWSEQNRMAGYPAMYTTYGFPPNLKVKIFPVPNSTGTLTLHVARLPATLDIATGAGNIEMVEGWLEVAYDYAEMMAQRKGRNPLWRESMELYEAKVLDMINTIETLNANGEIIWAGGSMVPRHLADWNY